MTIYLCLDDRRGLRFNGRRQSRDAAVLSDMAARLEGALTIAPHSERLIRGAQIPYQLLEAGMTCDLFLEDVPTEEQLSCADRLVIYRWNRHYPADITWETDPDSLGFRLETAGEFPGKSHERIGWEVYVR